MTIQHTPFAVASSTEFAASCRASSVTIAAQEHGGHVVLSASHRFTTPSAGQAPHGRIFTVRGAAVAKPSRPMDQATEDDDVLAALLAEAEADPSSAQALQEGRRWVQEQFYGDGCLASLRLSRGLSQSQLAERCGMSQSNIARFEAGGAMPQLPNARRLSEQLGVSVEAIFSACERSRDKAD